MILILFNISCIPKSLVLSQTEIVSFYFDKKIKMLGNKDNINLDDKRNLIKTKVEYAYGILMEKGDRLVEEDYIQSFKYYEKAYKLFVESKESCIALLTKRYPDFNHWLKSDSEILFIQSDIYWTT